MPFAYFAPDVKDAMEARESPRFARIMAAGPWQFRDYALDGVRGVLAEWKGTSLGPDGYGTPRRCADGLTYLPSKVPLRQEDLAKPHPPAGVDFTTRSGVTLTIPLALAAPRFVAFGGGDGGWDPADEFARLAFRLSERLAEGDVPFGDPELLKLIESAIAQTYRVTAEALNDLRWITTVDLWPIVLAIWGRDPFGSADAGASSRSPASASSTSP